MPLLSYSIFETFEETTNPATNTSTSGAMVNRERNDKITAEPIFCGRGAKYDSLSNRCDPCEDKTYQAISTPHRNVECTPHPTLGPSDCADGKYFFVDEKGVNELYNTTKERILKSTDFCKEHEIFGPMQCDPDTYLQTSKIPELRKTVKDRKLTNADYCAPQPAFQTIACERSGYFENRTTYDEIIAAREKKATRQNVCANTVFANKVVEVLQTAFDQGSNVRSFRSVKLAGRFNTDGKVTLKPTAQKTIQTASTPDDRRKASSVWSGESMGAGHGRGTLDSEQAWSSQRNESGQWYEVDLGQDKMVTGLVTRGRGDADQWVTAYKVFVASSSATTENDWEWVDDERVFGGNWDRNTKVFADFDEPVVARYVRVYPTSWEGHMSLRFDVRVAESTGIVNDKPTVVDVKKNTLFNMQRTEASVGLYDYDVEFTDAYRNRTHLIDTAKNVYLYDFSFSLSADARRVRKGSDNYVHPKAIGEHHRNLKRVTDFDKNKVGLQNIVYNVEDPRSKATLSRTYGVTVYDAKASIKSYAEQNTKKGVDHKAPEFTTVNMTIQYVGGMPGKNDIVGNAHTYTGHYRATDIYDPDFKIDLHPKVTKYVVSWPTVKNLEIRRNQAYAWGHHFTNWGTNCEIIHAQYNWHPHHNIDTNWVKSHVHHRQMRFYARNKYDHGEGRWLTASIKVIPNTFRVNVRAYIDKKFSGAGNVTCQLKVYNKHNHHWKNCDFSTTHLAHNTAWCSYDINEGDKIWVSKEGTCHGKEETYRGRYDANTSWIKTATDLTQPVRIENKPHEQRVRDAAARAAAEAAKSCQATRTGGSCRWARQRCKRKNKRECDSDRCCAWK